MAGLSASGFETKDYQTILDEMKTSVRASPAFGPEAQLHDATLLGSLLAVVALQLADIWESLVADYQALDSRQASGVALDNHLRVAGTSRLSADSSTASCAFYGTPGTIVAAGTIVELTGTAYQVETDEVATIEPWGDVVVGVTCTQTGPIELPAGGLTTLVTVNPGITSVTNAADGTPGRNIETDTEARDRLEGILQDPDAAGLDTLYTTIQAIDGVDEVRVYQNDTDLTDVNGLPPHSFMTVVFGTYSSADVVQAIWTAKPAGIQTYGSFSEGVLDAQGGTQTIWYSDANQVPIYFRLTSVVMSSGTFTVAKQDVISLAILTAFSGQSQTSLAVPVFQRIDQDVYYEAIRSAVFGTAFSDGTRIISGDFRIGLTNPPTLQVDIAMGIQDVAQTAGSQIAYV